MSAYIPTADVMSALDLMVFFTTRRESSEGRGNHQVPHLRAEAASPAIGTRHCQTIAPRVWLGRLACWAGAR